MRKVAEKFVEQFKRLTLAEVIGVLTITVLVGLMVYFSCSTQRPGHVDGAKIIAAARAYTSSLRAEGLPLPASVSLQELIKRGLLTTADVSAFSDMEVTINLAADDTQPLDVLIRARLANGQEIVVLSDGSIQQVSSSRHK